MYEPPSQYLWKFMLYNPEITSKLQNQKNKIKKQNSIDQISVAAI